MTERKVSGYLSKSLFIRGHQCHKSLWLHKYQPELKDAVDEAQQARFDSGHDVGALAQQLFPGGVEVDFYIPASSRISIKAKSGNATSGYLAMNLWS